MRAEWPHEIRNIVILTGAGVSAESGVATFRGPDGLWEGHRVEDVCTPEAYARDPALVHAFYNARRATLATVEPNAAHVALARLDAEWPGELLLVTQNVDDLHERAGSKRLLHMHGEHQERLVPGLRRAVRLGRADGRRLGVPALRQTSARSAPTSSGSARCRTRWTGSRRRCANADLFVSIGTSGAVYPAAGFVQTARYCGAHCLEINLEPSQGSVFFHESRIGTAGELVPAWVEEVLAA